MPLRHLSDLIPRTIKMGHKVQNATLYTTMTIAMIQRQMVQKFQESVGMFVILTTLMHQSIRNVDTY